MELTNMDLTSKEKTVLKLIGYWHDKTNRQGDLESIPVWAQENPELIIGFIDPWIEPQWVINPDWRPEFRQHIVEYLKAGYEVLDSLGYSYCRFNCGIPNEEMGSVELTDGKWKWPIGLAHYVEKHFVMLPEEFFLDIKSNEFKISSEISESLIGTVVVDFEFWLDWSYRASGREMKKKHREWLDWYRAKKKSESESQNE